jgi:hypothetical protein
VQEQVVHGLDVFAEESHRFVLVLGHGGASVIAGDADMSEWLVLRANQLIATLFLFPTKTPLWNSGTPPMEQGRTAREPKRARGSHLPGSRMSEREASWHVQNM